MSGMKVWSHHETANFHPRHRHPRTAWVRLNRLRTGVGRFRSCLYKWDMAPFSACECGAEEQTVEHFVLHWPIYWHSRGVHGLAVLADEIIEWLLDTCLEI